MDRTIPRVANATAASRSSSGRADAGTPIDRKSQPVRSA
jgi:hypothetical protein